MRGWGAPPGLQSSRNIRAGAGVLWILGDGASSLVAERDWGLGPDLDLYQNLTRCATLVRRSCEG